MSDTTNPTGVEHLLAPDLSVGLQREQVPVTTYVDAYYWTCWVCGWLGTGLPSIDVAQREGGAHFRREHEQRAIHIIRKDSRPSTPREDG